MHSSCACRTCNSRLRTIQRNSLVRNSLYRFFINTPIIDSSIKLWIHFSKEIIYITKRKAIKKYASVELSYEKGRTFFGAWATNFILPFTCPISSRIFNIISSVKFKNKTTVRISSTIVELFPKFQRRRKFLPHLHTWWRLRIQNGRHRKTVFPSRELPVTQ